MLNLSFVKYFFKSVFFVILVVVFYSCARIGRPEGGPKDLDAPLLVIANPPYESTNFNEKEIQLEFNEFVKLKDINKQLIVSPPLKNPPLITPQNTASKTIKIQILDTLAKNTTYIFNFGSTIEDNNENNKIEIFKYVFSTGNYIDSLVTAGNIRDAFTKETPKNSNVLLYNIDSSFTDSIVFNTKPNYVANTLDSSNFNFTNLKQGKYLLIALQETSNDYIFNPKTDKIGFYPDTISLPKDSVLKKEIVLFNELQPYKFKRAKEVSKGKIVFGYEGLRENFNVKIISETPSDFKSISKFEKDKDSLNYWYTPFEVDSLNFVVSNANFIDSISVKLNKKKIDTLIVNATISNLLHFRDTLFFKSNNPVIQVDTGKIVITNKDTLAVPFASFIAKNENKIGLLFDKKQQENYKVTILPEAFSDIFGQKNDTLNYQFKTKELEDYGKITINIVNTESTNLIIDLLEGKNNDKLVERRFVSASESLVFDMLQPKTYYVRAIIDSNKNNKWDTGNYLLKQQPETIIYYEEALEVRANYFIENTFTVKK